MFFSRIYRSWRGVQMGKYEQIFDRIGNIFSGKVLDIGSGSGYLEQFLDSRGIRADIIALDVDKNIRMTNVVIGNGNKLPFKDSCFDSIISIDAMHLINGDFARVLKAGGVALFALFFNKENYEERKALLKEKLRGFAIEKELEIYGKENEYVILARKCSSVCKL